MKKDNREIENKFIKILARCIVVGVSVICVVTTQLLLPTFILFILWKASLQNVFNLNSISFIDALAMIIVSRVLLSGSLENINEKIKKSLQ